MCASVSAPRGAFSAFAELPPPERCQHMSYSARFFPGPSYQRRQRQCLFKTHLRNGKYKYKHGAIAFVARLRAQRLGERSRSAHEAARRSSAGAARTRVRRQQRFRGKKLRLESIRQSELGEGIRLRADDNARMYGMPRHVALIRPARQKYVVKVWPSYAFRELIPAMFSVCILRPCVRLRSSHARANT